MESQRIQYVKGEMLIFNFVTKSSNNTICKLGFSKLLIHDQFDASLTFVFASFDFYFEICMIMYYYKTVVHAERIPWFYSLFPKIRRSMRPLSSYWYITLQI